MLAGPNPLARIRDLKAARQRFTTERSSDCFFDGNSSMEWPRRLPSFLVWRTISRSASGSMPLGASDIRVGRARSTESGSGFAGSAGRRRVAPGLSRIRECRTVARRSGRSSTTGVGTLWFDPSPWFQVKEEVA